MDIAQEYLKKINDSEGIDKIKLQLEFAEKIRQKSPEICLQNALLAYNGSLELKNVDLELSSLYTLCSVSVDTNDVEQAEKWISILAERAIKTSRNEAIAGAYYFRYRLCRHAGKLEEAAENLNSALEFLNIKDHPHFISNCYIGLGNVYYELKEYDEALNYYNKAVPLAAEKSNGYYYLQQNIASVLIIKKDYKQAWEIYHKLLDTIPEGSVNLRKLVLENLGHVCTLIGEHAEALEYFNQVIEIINEKGTEYELPQYQCHKADILGKLGKREEALKLFKEAEVMAEKNNNIPALEEFYKSIIDFFESENNYKDLAEYQKKYLSLKERIIKENSLKKVNEFENRHKIDRYREQTKLLNEKNTLMLERNKTLKDAMQQLVGKNKDLETKLNNAFSTIQKKDVMLTANQRLASIGEMISIIAHQWKQPLNIINALVYSIKDAYNYDELDEKFLNEKSRMIDELIEYLSQTINDFRSFFEEKETSSFHVCEALKKALTLLEFAIKNENVIITTDCRKDFKIIGSPNELTQVLLNIINNARDAFKENNTQKPEIKISIYESEDINIIDIYNNGGAIPEHIAGNIFEAYVTSKGENGTGLGLNICQRIIEEHFEGEISCQNINDGVNFRIKFF